MNYFHLILFSCNSKCLKIWTCLLRQYSGSQPLCSDRFPVQCENISVLCCWDKPQSVFVVTWIYLLCSASLLIPDTSEIPLESCESFDITPAESGLLMKCFGKSFRGAVIEALPWPKRLYIHTHQQLGTLLRFRRGDVSRISSHLCRREEERVAGGRDGTRSNCASDRQCWG